MLLHMQAKYVLPKAMKLSLEVWTEQYYHICLFYVVTSLDNVINKMTLLQTMQIARYFLVKH
jgi:hypothetical protein